MSLLVGVKKTGHPHPQALISVTEVALNAAISACENGPGGPVRSGVVAAANPLSNLLVLSRECGNEPRESLKGNHQSDGL